MIKLKRITTLYCENEDRIKLTGKDANDMEICLWLSQRFLIRLIPHMLTWLENITAVDAKVDPGSTKSIQNFKQYEAHSRLKPEPAAGFKETQTPSIKKKNFNWLVHEVDIKESAELMLLIFKNQDGHMAEILFKTIEIRQWLIILHSQWTKSEWPRNIWPNWVASPEKVETKSYH